MGRRERDEDLLARHLAGDRGAFEELMRRHEGRVFAVALRLTRDRSDALEATQNAFVSAFSKAGSFRGEAAFSTWLHRIAVNACRDLMRRRKDVPLDPAAGAFERAGEGSVEAAAGARVDVARALRTLPQEYREAVVLYDLAGLSYEEVAAATRAPLGTVKSRISRGRRMLARALEPEPTQSTSKGGP